MNRNRLKSIIEGLIFSQNEPLNAETLARIIRESSKNEIQAVLDELEDEYHKRARGFHLVKVAGGYQFRTLPTLAPWIVEMKKIKPARLSRAALEVLTIIAYNQPVTRSKVEQIRGVESSGILKSLMEKDLVTIIGRKDIPGRPLLYGTTKRFLELLGLPDLGSLPPLPEPESLIDEPNILQNQKNSE